MAKNTSEHNEDKVDVLEDIDGGKKQPVPEGFEIFGGGNLFADDLFYDDYAEEVDGETEFHSYEVNEEKQNKQDTQKNSAGKQKASEKREQTPKKKTKKVNTRNKEPHGIRSRSARKPISEQIVTDARQAEASATNVLGIDENQILDVLPILLEDHTTNKNIIWAADAYEHHGDDYSFSDEIKLEQITGDNHDMIKPRIAKSAIAQANRTKQKAEVFTPSWVCNLQNNKVDETWFGFPGAFNTEIDNDENKVHSWKASDHVPFEKVNDPKKTWQQYILDNRMEITCGEAPYLTSRYDTTNGMPIALHDRIGLIDRKLRVIKENVLPTPSSDNEDSGEKALYKYAQQAYKTIFGFEWQGDNLLLARENLCASFIDFWRDATGHDPSFEQRSGIARIISNNLIQMDGIELTIPGSDTPATIVDWDNDEKRIPFYSLIHDKNGNVVERKSTKEKKASKTNSKQNKQKNKTS